MMILSGDIVLKLVNCGDCAERNMNLLVVQAAAVLSSSFMHRLQYIIEPGRFGV